MKELIIKKGDKQITVADKEDVMDALSNKVSTDDPRLTNARTPTSHTHGNLQNNGQVGSTVQASKNVVTDANGKITTENKPSIPTKTSQLTNDGDGTNVFVKNNDSRLTNARTPTSHTHTKTDITTVTIPKKADLNDDAYWQVGIYTVDSTNGGTISNRPDYLTGNYAFELEVHGFGSTLLQILKTLTSNNNYERIFYRAKTGGGFSQWFRIANYDEIPLGHVITSGDIDTLTDDGSYGIYKTNINNKNITGDLPPTDRTNGVRSFLLESRKYDDNSSIQFAYILSAAENYNRVFYRSRAGGAWDTWREIVQISDIDSINTALDTKQNEVETQAKVTQFTNKDRITLERIIERMNNPDSKALFLRPTDSSLPYYTFCENIKVATTYNRGVSLYLDGAAIDTSASNVVLKKIDGTKIGDFNKRGTDPAGWGYSFAGANLGVGIHYLYAEATFPDGSVRKSNILSVFIKDTTNLYDYAQWSSGEYDNINIIANRGKVKITEQFSTIGEKSIAYQQSNPANYGSFYVDSTNTLTSGENYTVSLDCYCPDANFTFIVMQDEELSRVTIPRNPSMQHISLSFTSNRSASFRIKFFNDVSDSRIFIDNLSCIKL